MPLLTEDAHDERGVMRVFITDAEFGDLDLERQLLRDAGLEPAIGFCRTPAEILAAARGAQALLVQYAPITREVLEGLPGLRIVSRYGVGVDNVDLEAARRLGVTVTNVPDYGVEEVAGHTLALLLALARGVVAYHELIRSGGWGFDRVATPPRLSELTLGLLGVGRIGRAVAVRAAAFGMQVIGYDAQVPPERFPAQVRPVDFTTLLSTSDVLSLHVPLTNETRGVIGREALAQMKPGAYLINTARGGLVDEAALVEAIDAGRLAGAGLDVFAREPLAPDDPLRRHPKVILTPHAAFYSRRSVEDLRRKAVQNIIDVAQGRRPRYVVE